MRFTLVDRRLFLGKTACVFALTLLVVPLAAVADGLPADLYVIGLIALHVFVLGIYLYRVRFRDLDPDPRSLVARIAALVVVVYLLAAMADFRTDLVMLAVQMVVISLLHTLVLALLMIRVTYPERATQPVPAERAR